MGLAVLASTLSAGALVPVTASADEAVQELVVVDSSNPSDTTAQLSTYELGPGDDWIKVLGPIKAFVGEDGIGTPQDDVPRTPVGQFDLTPAFGRLPNPGTKMPYTQVTDHDYWDEDESSPTYNTMVHAAEVPPGGPSENLYDSGVVYDYAVNIAHNPQRIPGNASGIFLHVTNGEPTLGCVAVDEQSMKSILTWLDPAKHPQILIGVGAHPPAAVPQSASQVPAGPAVQPQDLISTLMGLVKTGS